MNKNKIKLTVWLIMPILFVNVLFAEETGIKPDSVKYEFAPIVVTGQRYQMPQNDVASSISIVSAKEIQNTNLTAAADAISYLTPGVYTTRRSSMGYGVAALGAGSITVRGIGGKPNSQVLVLIDGRPDFQGIFSHPLNDAYPLDNVDHIEVLRGPASAVYGSNALGGVINIITKKLPTSGFHTNLKFGYGSYNTQNYLLQNSGVLENFQYFISAGLNSSDGHRENSSFDGKNLALKLGYQFNSNFQLTFNGSVTPNKFNDPGPEGLDLYGYFEHGKIVRNSLDLTLSNKFNNTDGTIKLHGNFGRHDLSDGWKSDDQTNGIIIFQNFLLPFETKTTIGIDVKRYGGTAESNGTKLGTFFNDEIAGYIHLQKTFVSKLVVAAGLRLEDNSHFGREWLPKFGLVYHLFSTTAIRGSASKGFRTPSIKDLYLYAPANKDLLPERIRSYEIGVNQTLGQKFSLDVCGYYYEGTQLIEATGRPPQNLNIGENQAKGFEISLNARPVENLSANLSYSYLDAKKIVPFAPNKFNFFVTYQFNKIVMAVYGEYVTDLYASYQINQFPLIATTEQMFDYTLAHFKISYPLINGLNLTMTIENLLNTNYEILKGYPMPKRTFFSSLNYQF